MKYAVIGTGAIGAYYGGKLAHAGNEVHFLAHSDAEAMRKALTVDSCLGSFVIDHPNVYTDTSQIPPVDVIIVALKTVNNGLLPALLKPMLKNNPVVLLIQNGICVEADLARNIPGIRLVAGLAFICSTKVGPAHVSHQDYGPITLADYSATDEATADIAADLIAAGVQTDIVDYHYGRWRKAVWNLPFNGLTVLLDTDTLHLVNDPGHLANVRKVMTEVVAIANAAGVNALTADYIDEMINRTRVMKPYAPSMKVDYDNNRPMEVQYLYTRAIDEAHRLGVPTPALDSIHLALLAIQERFGR